MPNDLELDDRIRALVSSAIADAPTAPDVEFVHPVARKRMRWAKWTAALAALLAAGGATVALQPADHGDVDTTHDTTATTAFTPRHEPSVIVTAGTDGIRENVDGVERVVSTERMLQAVPLDNGEVVAVRSVIYTSNPYGNPPVVIAADGTTTPLFDHPPASAMIYDFSVVDGRRLVLYSVNTNDPSAPPERDRKVVLYTLDLDTKVTTEIAQIGDSFSDGIGLSLGSNGLIVGTHTVSSACGFCNDPASASRSLLVLAVPGSPAAARPLPKPGDYGLKEKYEFGGCECPMNFFTDATGESLYWVSTKPDGSGTAVYSARIAEPGKPATLVKALPDHGATVAETFPDISSRGLVVNYADAGDGPLHGPVLLAADGEVQLLGHYAAVGWQG